MTDQPDPSPKGSDDLPAQIEALLAAAKHPKGAKVHKATGCSQCTALMELHALVPLFGQSVVELLRALERIEARARRIVQGDVQCTSFSAADYDLQVTRAALRATEERLDGVGDV